MLLSSSFISADRRYKCIQSFECSVLSISQAENREVLEIVRSQEDVLAAHQRVSGMNFIPSGHVILASIRNAQDEVESQLVEGALAETDTQPPSPNPINETREEEDDDDDDDDEPSIPKVIVISSSPDRRPLPPPQLQTPPASNPANTYTKKSKSLHVNIQQPLSNELIRRVAKALGTPLPSSPGASPTQRRGTVSPSAPTREDLPQEELSPLRERRTKMKHDKRHKKRPRG